MTETTERYASRHNKAKLKIYCKSWRDKHKVEGKCLDCNSKVVQGKSRCQYHLDYQLEHKKRGVK